MSLFTEPLFLDNTTNTISLQYTDNSKLCSSKVNAFFKVHFYYAALYYCSQYAHSGYCFSAIRANLLVML